ncbi:MAG TPA: hypothetical protein PKA82_01805 [Pyrinomonadaceae bacterium]|nr:hypothetical protein [Pyrinomonadaceae bacterium]
MKKLVLGIISVFLTQLIFVAYNWTGDELAADVGRVSEYKIETEPWPVIRTVRPPYPETIALAGEQPQHDETRNVQPVVIATSVKTPPKAERRTTLIKNDVTFKPTVITYSNVPVTFSERPQIAAAPATERIQTLSAQPVTKKKRSLIQKTGSVIKKPFVWIKNLVAKID